MPFSSHNKYKKTPTEKRKEKKRKGIFIHDFSTSLKITPTATERRAQLAVLMRKVENRLGQVGRLHDTAYFHGAFVFNEFAD